MGEGGNTHTHTEVRKISAWERGRVNVPMLLKDGIKLSCVMWFLFAHHILRNFHHHLVSDMGEALLKRTEHSHLLHIVESRQKQLFRPRLHLARGDDQTSTDHTSVQPLEHQAPSEQSAHRSDVRHVTHEPCDIQNITRYSRLVTIWNWSDQKKLPPTIFWRYKSRL